MQMVGQSSVNLWASDYLDPGYINQDALGLTEDQGE